MARYRVHRIEGSKHESPVVPDTFEFIKTQYEEVHPGWEHWQEYFYYFKEEIKDENKQQQL